MPSVMTPRPVFHAAVVWEAELLPLVAPLMLPEPDDPALFFPQEVNSSAAASAQPQRTLGFLIDTLPFRIGLGIVCSMICFLL